MVPPETEEECTGSAERLHWSVASAASEVVVSLDGELDLATVEPLGRVLAKILERRPATVAIDAACLSFLDSTGIRCLVDAAQTAAAVGCDLVVRRPTTNVLRVLEILGLDDFLLEDADRDSTAHR